MRQNIAAPWKETADTLLQEFLKSQSDGFPSEDDAVQFANRLSYSPICRALVRLELKTRAPDLVSKLPVDMYSDWTDSTAEPFLCRMLADDDNRDHHRLAFADWLVENACPNEAEHFANSKGSWEAHGGCLSWWCVPGRSTPLHWVGWSWLLPKTEWLQSTRCADLVSAWLRNGVFDGGQKYWWAAGVKDRLSLPTGTPHARQLA